MDTIPRRRCFFFPHFVSLFLIACLALPAPCFALRPTGLEESGPTKEAFLKALGATTGLEEGGAIAFNVKVLGEGDGYGINLMILHEEAIVHASDALQIEFGIVTTSESEAIEIAKRPDFSQIMRKIQVRLIPETRKVFERIYAKALFNRTKLSGEGIRQQVQKVADAVYPTTRSIGLEEVTPEKVREAGSKVAEWFEKWLDGTEKALEFLRKSKTLDDDEARQVMGQLMNSRPNYEGIRAAVYDASEVFSATTVPLEVQGAFRATVGFELSNAVTPIAGFAELTAGSYKKDGIAVLVNYKLLSTDLFRMRDILQRVRAMLWELQALKRVELVREQGLPSSRIALVASSVPLTEQGKTRMREKLTQFNTQAAEQAAQHPTQSLTVLGPWIAGTSPGFVKYLLDSETPEVVTRQFGVVTYDEALLSKLQAREVLSAGSFADLIEELKEREINVHLYVDEDEEAVVRTVYDGFKEPLPPNIQLRLVHTLDRSLLFLNLLGIETPSAAQRAEAAWVAVAIERYYQ